MFEILDKNDNSALILSVPAHTDTHTELTPLTIISSVGSFNYFMTFFINLFLVNPLQTVIP